MTRRSAAKIGLVILAVFLALYNSRNACMRPSVDRRKETVWYGLLVFCQ